MSMQIQITEVVYAKTNCAHNSLYTLFILFQIWFSLILYPFLFSWQSFTGVNYTAATSPKFVAAFKSIIAGYLNILTSAVTISSTVDTSSRRMLAGIDILQQRGELHSQATTIPSVSVQYTVTASGTSIDTVISTLNAKTQALTISLQAAGFPGATAASPQAVTSPTSPPTGSPIVGSTSSGSSSSCFAANEIITLKNREKKFISDIKSGDLVLAADVNGKLFYISDGWNNFCYYFQIMFCSFLLFLPSTSYRRVYCIFLKIS